MEQVELMYPKMYLIKRAFHGSIKTVMAVHFFKILTGCQQYFFHLKYNNKIGKIHVENDTSTDYGHIYICEIFMLIALFANCITQINQSSQV